MADVPPQVHYGFITGRFVQFVADTGDASDVPDEIPLSGTVTLKPTVSLMRFPSTVPPRTAVITTVVCKIVDGNLLAPDGSTKLSVVASDQPDGDPSYLQWKVDIRLDGVTVQPAPITIEVPTNATIDLTSVIPSPPEPPAILIVSTVDREKAEAAAAAAALSAGNAEIAAQAALSAQDDAEAAADAAAASLDAMPGWWFGTQAQYDAIAPKDPDVLYAITG